MKGRGVREGREGNGEKHHKQELLARGNHLQTCCFYLYAKNVLVSTH